MPSLSACLRRVLRLASSVETEAGVLSMGWRSSYHPLIAGGVYRLWNIVPAGGEEIILRSLAANAHAAGQVLIAGGEVCHRLIVHLEKLRIVPVARADQKTVQRFVAMHDQEG